MGGINSLWPLFGIANQMLAAIALCLATTIILKMALSGSTKRSPALALIALVPLVWLLAVTFTAGAQKIWHSDPRIGFLSGARAERNKLAALVVEAKSTGDFAKLAEFIRVLPELEKKCERVVFNLHLDAVVAGAFLILVSIVVLLSIIEWARLLSRSKPVVLHETDPVWLPDYAVVEGGRKLGGAAGAATLAVALAKELSGEAQLARAQQQVTHCECRAGGQDKSTQEIYVEVTEQRFNGVRRCC